MTSEAAEAPAQAGSSANRVDGWSHYYQYFNKLDADMEHTHELAATRRTPAGSTTPLAREGAIEEGKCFEKIADAIKGSDKPLVQLEDDENGGVRLSAEVTGLPNGRTLTNEDLRQVRAQLRAKAHASNLRSLPPINALEGQGDPLPPGLRAQAGAESAKAALAASAKAAGKKPSNAAGKKKVGKDGEPDAATSAAAIETLLWFGMALGEGKGRKGDAGSSDAALAPLRLGRAPAPRVSSFIDLEQLSRCFDEHDADPSMGGGPAVPGFEEVNFAAWDWVSAMSEVGLHEDDVSQVVDLCGGADVLEQCEQIQRQRSGQSVASMRSAADSCRPCGQAIGPSSKLGACNKASRSPTPSAASAANTEPTPITPLEPAADPFLKLAPPPAGAAPPAAERFDSEGAETMSNKSADTAEASGAGTLGGFASRANSLDANLDTLQGVLNGGTGPATSTHSASNSSHGSETEDAPLPHEDVAAASSPNAKRQRPSRVSTDSHDSSSTGADEATVGGSHRTSPYVSPARATRKSKRGAVPKKTIEIEVDAPLLKWEKEQQQKRGGSRPRRASAEGKKVSSSSRTASVDTCLDEAEMEDAVSAALMYETDDESCHTEVNLVESVASESLQRLLGAGHYKVGGAELSASSVAMSNAQPEGCEALFGGVAPKRRRVA